MHNNDLTFANHIIAFKIMKVKNVYSTGLWYLSIHTERIYMYIYTYVISYKTYPYHICKIYAIPVYTYITYTYHIEHILYIIYMICVK